MKLGSKDDIITLISLNECASRLGVSKGTVKNLITRGQLKAVKIAARTMVREVELARFIAALPAAGGRSE